MPFLSAILSIVAVGALATYEYLNHSKKIEEAKQKIVEVQRVEDTTKKIFFKRASESRINVEHNSSKVLLKLSDLAVQDGTLTKKDLKLLDNFQSAVESLPISVQNPTCQDLANTKKITLDDCLYISKKNINYYSQSVTGELDSNSSVIKNKDLRESVAIWSKDKNKRYLKKDLYDNSKKAKIIKSTKDPDLAVLILNSDQNTNEDSLGKEKLYTTLQEVAQKSFSADEKEKILKIVKEKRAKLLTFKNKVKNEDKKREQQILLGRLNRMMMYYQKRLVQIYNQQKISYAEAIKHNQEVDKKIKKLDESYFKELRYLEERMKHISKYERWWSYFTNSTSSYDIYKRKIADLKRKYKLKKEQLLASKKDISKLNTNTKKVALEKLNRCYFSQKAKAYPNLLEFKKCSSKVLNIF